MKNTWFILIFSILVSCGTSTERRDVSQISRNEKLYVVDIDDTPKEDFIRLSSFFQDVETIVLETNENCIIGEVNNIRVMDDYIIVMDSRKTESVLVFDKEGRFLHRIGKIGQGPGEYLEIADSSIDFEDRHIYIYDFQTNTIHKYDIASGNHINSINISGADFMSYFIQYINGKIYASAIPNSETDDSFLLHEFDASTGKSGKSYLRASEYNKGWNSFFTRLDGFFYPNEDRSSKYVQIFMDTVISIKDEVITPYLAIKSKNWITKKDIKELIEYKTANDGSMSHELLFERNISYNIEQYFECGNIIYFKYQNNGHLEFVFFDKDKNTTRRGGWLRDDIVYNGDWFLLPNFAYSDNKGVYSYLMADQIPLFLEIAYSGGLSANLDKLDILKKLEEDANPVIFYYSKNK